MKVNFGIDLGTTNSAIAHMSSKGVQIIPIRQMNYIPSAVGLDRHGNVKVGVDALKPGVESVRRFKLQMGTSHTYPVGGVMWTPTQLSAEVLKVLRDVAKLRTSEDLIDVVITVPAMFSLPQYDATNEAAKLAGLDAVALIQEPIAAATAYLSGERVPGNYLVYDLGGGTFDTSVIRVDDDEMTVLKNAGDNYLGGGSFDRKLFEWVLRELDLDEADIDPVVRKELLVLCEEAREELSDSESALIGIDDLGISDVSLKISRRVLEDQISGFISRTIQIAKAQLQDIGLTPDDIRSILLVGGPTRTPYIRQRLADEFGIHVDQTQDPMTVVVRGAALHAATLDRKKINERSEQIASEAILDLFYDQVMPYSQRTISGTVTLPIGFNGQVRLIQSGNRGETEWINLENGSFVAEVDLGQSQQAEVKIQLRDQEENLVTVSPDAISLSIGIRAAPNLNSRDIGFVLEDGHVMRLASAGESLPIDRHYTVALTKTIMAGYGDSVRVILVEGSSLLAKDCLKIGSLTIRGTDLKQTLRQSKDVDIRVLIDPRGIVATSIHVPSLDVDLPVEMHKVIERKGIADLTAALNQFKVEIKHIEEFVDDLDCDNLMQTSREIEGLETLIDRVQNGETEVLDQLLSQLLEAKLRLRPIIAKYKLKADHARTIGFAEYAASLCSEYEDKLGLATLDELKEAANNALDEQNEQAMEMAHDQVNCIFWPHFAKKPECYDWILWNMRRNTYRASDALAYHELFRKAEVAFADGDFEGVQLAYRKSQVYLPEDDEDGGNRFSGTHFRTTK